MLTQEPWKSDDKLYQEFIKQVNKDELDAFEIGRQASQIIRSGWKREWEQWLLVGGAFQVGIRSIKIALGIDTDTPPGRLGGGRQGGFNALFNRWMAEYEMDERLINQNDRAALLRLMHRKDEVEAWRKTLTLDQRTEYYNPRRVEKEFKAYEEGITNYPTKKASEAKKNKRKKETKEKISEGVYRVVDPDAPELDEDRELYGKLREFWDKWSKAKNPKDQATLLRTTFPMDESLADGWPGVAFELSGGLDKHLDRWKGEQSQLLKERDAAKATAGRIAKLFDLVWDFLMPKHKEDIRKKYPEIDRYVDQKGKTL